MFAVSILFINSMAQANSLDESLLSLKKKSASYGKVQTTKSMARKGLKKTFLNANFEINKAIYKLEAIFPITENEFQSEKNNLTSVIIKSYEDQPTPYAGEITNVAKCSAVFKPVFIEEQASSGKIYILKTLVSRDLSYGLCDKKSIMFSACTSFYYDQKTSQFLKINVYTNPSLKCEKLVLDLVKSFINI